VVLTAANAHDAVAVDDLLALPSPPVPPSPQSAYFRALLGRYSNYVAGARSSGQLPALTHR